MAALRLSSDGAGSNPRADGRYTPCLEASDVGYSPTTCCPCELCSAPAGDCITEVGGLTIVNCSASQGPCGDNDPGVPETQGGWATQWGPCLCCILPLSCGHWTAARRSEGWYAVSLSSDLALRPSDLACCVVCGMPVPNSSLLVRKINLRDDHPGLPMGFIQDLR
ncbi:hypothetical protein NDU88_005651 [Pleurodeles waltl]|uniref:Uncharacterized protein n=1 Tax=Pleurodeles waltl TaxID=8319 RepID=A0AAV7UKR4_PLEWA|nr:hypothetical protein NDU88_005651 [Pleurodeles waltl]